MNNTITYDKPFKTNDELIELLESRNVIITDKEFAKRCLSDISYYNLINGYKNLYPINSNDEFNIPIPFYEFYNLYTFDTLLNSVVFKYIIAIEKSLKSKIAYIVSENYGIYTDLYDPTNNRPNDYLYKKNYRNSTQTQNIIKDIKEIVNKSKDESIKHYKTNHNHIPCWILINGITFGSTIKWYDILKPDKKELICNQILPTSLLNMMDKKEFVKKGLTILRKYRNNIAHGHKIFFNSIVEELPKRQVLTISNNLVTDADYRRGIGRNDIFAVIIIICAMVDKRSKDLFLSEIINIFNAFNNSVFSSGKTLLEMLELPNDFISKLEQIRGLDLEK